VYRLSRYASVMASIALGLTIGGCGSTSPQGANPVSWVGTFCSGLGTLIVGQNQLAKTPPVDPQGAKDAMLKQVDIAQQAFTNIAHELTQLGPPAITNGKQIQNSTVGFFTNAASIVVDRRAKLAALDTNDPNFVQKSNRLFSSNLAANLKPVQGMISNRELAPAFSKAPECRRLATTAVHQ